MITQIIGVITTEAEHTDTGILFYEDGTKIYILDIYPASPFASTDLQPGMLVVSVNNKLCEGVTADFVSTILKAMGTITILAQHDSTTMAPLTNSGVFTQSVIASISPPQPSAPPIESGFSDNTQSYTVDQAEYPIVQAELVTERHPQNPTVVLPNSAILVQQQQTQTTVLYPQSQSAPPGVLEGGVWGTIKVVGGKTCFVWWAGVFVGCWPLLFICCCPLDRKSAYRVSDRIYDRHGKYLGSTRSTNFIPDRSMNNIISN